MKFCYYAHCTSIYNTPQEQRDIEILEDMGFHVYNPNNVLALQKYREEGMDWFFGVVRGSDVLVFRALPGGDIPAGIAGEIEVAREEGIPVLQLPSHTAKVLSVEETRNYLKEVGQR